VKERLGTTVGERFRLISLIGEGGMGTVYLAEDVAAGGQAAVKFLRDNLVSKEEFVARFRQEARSASRFRHESAVRVLATGEDKASVPWIAMEHCGGKSLKEVLQEEAPLSVGRACTIAMQVLNALSEAHNSGIIHRDLKPGNIKVEKRETGELAKILDFGVAKFVGSAEDEEMSGAVKTKTGVVFGTPKYMSPEQILGESVDSRSDIYSLGAIVYEMLTGTPPFVSEDILGFVTRHMKESVEPLSERAPEVEIPPDLERIVMETLEKNRVARPARAAALAKDFEPYAKAGSAVGRRRRQVRGLGFLAGGVAGALLSALLTPALASSSVATALGLGIGSTVAFLVFPRCGEASFWIRTLVVAGALAVAEAVGILAAGGPFPVGMAMGAAALFVYVLFAAGWGGGSRIAGAIMGGLLAPIAALPFLPIPAGEVYVRLWSVEGADLASLGPAVALLIIGIAFAAGALVAPEALKRTSV
jgi:hypothetical protein